MHTEGIHMYVQLLGAKECSTWIAFRKTRLSSARSEHTLKMLKNRFYGGSVEENTQSSLTKESYVINKN